MIINYYNQITIVIISYKSRNKVLKFIKKIPRYYKIIIVENSEDINLKNILKNFKNVSVYLRQNKGVSSAINYAVKKIKTKYFFQISPDLDFDFNKLKYFYIAANKMKNKFSALGPRYVNVNKKSHAQSNAKDKIGYVDAVHGSAMFIYKKNFNFIGGFDENFFLYFEENDYCRRGKKINLNSYQVNKIKVKKLGDTVEFFDKTKKQDLSNLLSWHFIWSKFYFFRKHYGYLFSLIYFIPIILRTIFKLMVYKNSNKNNMYQKYKFRYEGLKASIMGHKSLYRI